MGKYMRNCNEGVGEVAFMEVAQAGVRTRATAMAAEEAAEKRRKVGNGELRLPSSTLEQIETHGREDVLASPENFVSLMEDPSAPAASLNSGGVPASCYSSNGSTEKLKFSDLEEECLEFGTISSHNSDRRESTPTSEFMAESGELESTITSKPSSVMMNSRRTMPPEKMPAAAELEEFFAAAEEDLHKRFIDKYNFDIVNDVPLKGRFEWIQLKQ